ncbi:MAG: rhomboid family intramembrane serine protease [Rhodospirillales bacterium]
MTMAFIVANVAVYFYQLGLSPQSELYFIYTYALVPAVLNDPTVLEQTGLKTNPYLTLITNTFMHAGALHLIINMWTLWLFGGPLEDRMGRIRFTIFYFLCGATGSYGHYFFNADSTIPALGASGAIAGVLGGYTYLFPKAKVHLVQPIFFFPLIFRLPALIYTVIWFVLQVIEGAAELGARKAGEVGGIAWWAHIGGFAAGLILVWILCRTRPQPPASSGGAGGNTKGRSRIPSAGGMHAP